MLLFNNYLYYSVVTTLALRIFTKHLARAGAVHDVSSNPMCIFLSVSGR